MARDSTRVQAWLKRSTPSAARYAVLALREYDKDGSDPDDAEVIEQWAADTVFADIEAAGRSAFAAAQAHTDETEKHGRYRLSLHDAEGRTLSTHVLRTHYDGEEYTRPWEDTSIGGQLAHLQKHTEAQVLLYTKATEATLKQMSAAMSAMTQVLTMMSEREAAVIQRQADAEARHAELHDAATGPEAQAKALVWQVVAGYLQQGGASEILKAGGTALARLVPAPPASPPAARDGGSK